MVAHFGLAMQRLNGRVFDAEASKHTFLRIYILFMKRGGLNARFRACRERRMKWLNWQYGAVGLNLALERL